MITSAGFSRNGETALSASKDMTARLWSIDPVRRHTVLGARKTLPFRWMQCRWKAATFRAAAI
jgi:hypothetical protein